MCDCLERPSLDRRHYNQTTPINAHSKVASVRAILARRMARTAAAAPTDQPGLVRSYRLGLLPDTEALSIASFAEPLRTLTNLRSPIACACYTCFAGVLVAQDSKTAGLLLHSMLRGAMCASHRAPCTNQDNASSLTGPQPGPPPRLQTALRAAVRAAARGVPCMPLVCAMQRMCDVQSGIHADPEDVRIMARIARSQPPAIVQVRSTFHVDDHDAGCNS